MGGFDRPTHGLNVDQYSRNQVKFEPCMDSLSDQKYPMSQQQEAIRARVNAAIP